MGFNNCYRVGLYASWFLGGVLLLSSKKEDKQKKGIQHQSFILPAFITVLSVSVASVAGGPSDFTGEQADTLVEELSILTVILS